MDDKLRKELSRENLNRLSSDFEVELLRLIKTLNLISQSRELYKNQVEEIESISNNLKIKINDFTIKLLEIEKGARESAMDFSSSADNTEPNDYDTIIKEVNEFREKINAVDKDIERAKVEHLSKLDSFYTVYNLELKASQGELDTKLSDIKELIAEAALEPVVKGTAAPEIPAAPEPAQIQGNGSGGQPIPEPLSEGEAPTTAPSEFQKPHSGVLPKSSPEPPKKINLSERKPYREQPSRYGSSGLMLGIIFLFFGALVGVTSYYLLDYISGDETPSGLREKIYSEDSVTPREEDSSRATSEVKTFSLPETNIAKEEVAPQDELASDVAESPLKYLKGEPIEPSALITDATTNDAVDIDWYTVVGPGANVRNGPGINHSVATVVLEGDEFPAMGEKRGIWIKVMTLDGTEGWISQKVVKQID
jgi:Bacterial SH3 domain